MRIQNVSFTDSTLNSARWPRTIEDAPNDSPSPSILRSHAESDTADLNYVDMCYFGRVLFENEGSLGVTRNDTLAS